MKLWGKYERSRTLLMHYYVGQLCLSCASGAGLLAPVAVFLYSTGICVLLDLRYVST